MRTPRVPDELVEDVTTLRNRLDFASVQAGSDRALAPLIPRLNARLLEAPCFLDRLTGVWKYDFGDPIDRLPAGQVALGAHMFTPVGELVGSLLAASRRLREPGLTAYFHRLADESRHQDALVEMIPIAALGDDVKADFEVPAEGQTHGTIDWRVSPAVGPALLFDIKNRVADLVPHLRALAAAAGASAAAPAPGHDPHVLFRRVVAKFAAHDPSDCIHGVWIFTRLKQDECSLRAAFAALDGSRVHFAVVSNRKSECILLTRAHVDRQHVLKTLHIVEFPSRVTFRRENEG